MKSLTDLPNNDPWRSLKSLSDFQNSDLWGSLFLIPVSTASPVAGLAVARLAGWLELMNEILRLHAHRAVMLRSLNSRVHTFFGLDEQKYEL